VDLGSVEAILPPEEQVAGEVYAHGSRLRVYVTSVAKGTKGPQITVSRTHPGLVRKLFALEVPEIHAGLVEIVSLARESGHRDAASAGIVFARCAGAHCPQPHCAEWVRPVFSSKGSPRLLILISESSRAFALI
jgi:hypothetical protein